MFFFHIYLELHVKRRAKNENFGSKTLNEKIAFFKKFVFSATQSCQTYNSPKFYKSHNKLFNT